VKRVLTRQDIQKTLPPMSMAFKQKQLNTLNRLDQKKEEPIMKKKLSTAFVLALVLLIALSAVALAVALWKDTGVKIAEMEAEKGFFETWQVTDKVTLIRLLVDAGEIDMSADVAALLSGKLSDDEASQVATKLMIEYTSVPEDVVTLIAVLQKLNGQLSTWSAEDKVWYRELLVKNGLLSPEDVLYEVPIEDAISSDAAVQIAKETIVAAYPISDEALDRFAVNTTYYVPDWERSGLSKGEAIWNVEFVLTAEESKDHAFHVYMVEMKKDGSVLGHLSNDRGLASDQLDQWEVEKGPFREWSWEDQATYSKLLAQMVAQDRISGVEPSHYTLAVSQIGFGIPGSSDIAEQEAIRIAVDYAKSFYGATEQGVALLKPYTSFDVTNPESPIWRVKFLAWKIEDWSNYESTGYVVHINANTGEVVRSLNRKTDRVTAIDLL